MARNKHPELTVERILDVASDLFFRFGYENTTIQDIIDALGDLSKGAIYHHFKSKEEIIVAVSKRVFDRELSRFCDNVQGDNGFEGETGLEKLKNLFYTSLRSQTQETFVKSLPDMMKNPKLLAVQLESTMNYLAPNVVLPIIRKGIADGSIKTDCPEALAEIILFLPNTWLNPLIFKYTKEELKQRVMVYRRILQSFDIDFLDDEMLEMVERLRSKLEHL